MVLAADHLWATKVWNSNVARAGDQLETLDMQRQQPHPNRYTATGILRAAPAPQVLSGEHS